MKTIAPHSFERVAVWVNVLAVPILAFFLTGCGAGNLPHGAVYVENSKTSIVVLGVAPHMKVLAFPVTRGSQGWNQSKLDSAAINAAPRNGYIVAEVAPTKSGEAYALVKIIPELLDIWHVCSGGAVVTIQVPPRSIVYVGDITIVKDGKYRIDLRHDFAKASQFMRQHFPSMATRLTEGRASMERMEDGEC